MSESTSTPAATRITLSFWSKGSASMLRQTTGTNVQRIYINLDGSCDALGYFEMREHFSGRGTDSYYDLHRHAHGDSVTSQADQVVWHGPEGVGAAVLDAVLGDKPCGLGANWREARESDQWGLWRALQEQSRNFRYYVAKRPKTAIDKKIAAANEARQALVFDIDLAAVNLEHA